MFGFPLFLVCSLIWPASQTSFVLLRHFPTYSLKMVICCMLIMEISLLKNAPKAKPIFCKEKLKNLQYLCSPYYMLLSIVRSKVLVCTTEALDFPFHEDDNRLCSTQREIATQKCLIPIFLTNYSIWHFGFPLCKFISVLNFKFFYVLPRHFDVHLLKMIACCTLLIEKLLLKNASKPSMFQREMNWNCNIWASQYLMSVVIGRLGYTLCTTGALQYQFH